VGKATRVQWFYFLSVCVCFNIPLLGSRDGNIVYRSPNRKGGRPPISHETKTKRELPKLGQLSFLKDTTGFDPVALDSQDTFLDAKHLRESFPEYEVEIINNSGAPEPVRPFRVTFPPPLRAEEPPAPHKRKAGQANGVAPAQGGLPQGGVIVFYPLLNSSSAYICCIIRHFI
jgi:Intron-binding protein aquarius N-terminus